VRIRAGVRPDTLLRQYVLDLQALRRSKALCNNATRVLPRLFVFLKRRRVSDLRTVREEHLAAFARTLGEAQSARGAVLALNSQAAYLRAVKGFFRFLERRDVLLRDPARAIELPRIKRLPRAHLSEAHVRRLISHCDDPTLIGIRDRAIVELLYGTGIRAGECERLDAVDVGLLERVLLIRNGKGKKDRVVPIPERAIVALDRYLRDGRPALTRSASDGALFLSATGRRFQVQCIEILVRGCARGAGLSVRATPHMLRHACATHLLKGGASVRHIQALLGHKRLSTTAIYTRVAVADLHEVLKRAHPRGR